MTVQTSTDRRFHRVHIRPKRRRRIAAVRRRIASALGLMGVVSLLAFLLPGALSTAHFLSIDTIVVEGNVHVAQGEITALIGQLRSQNILLADLESHRQQLLTLGWVKSATLRRVLPSTIEVDIYERSPLGLARFGSRLYLVDDEGVLIDEHGPGFSEAILPIIDGLSGEPSMSVDSKRVRLVSNLIGALEMDPALASQVSQINVENPYDAVVILSDSPTLIHLGDDQFLRRLREFLGLKQSLKEYVTDIDSVDLRFEHRVFIRPVNPSQDLETTVAARRIRRMSIQ